MASDLRQLALLSADQLEKLSEQFPPGEPGRKWMRALAVRLKNGYARTRGQQKILLLQRIGSGCRKISELVEELGYSRREVEGLIFDLKADDYLHEHEEKQLNSAGRPYRWLDLTEKGEQFISCEK